MVQPPKPTKTQQAVAANKAAQQQRQQRVAETTQKLSQIQTKPKRVTKPVTQQVAVEPVATVPTTFIKLKETPEYKQRFIGNENRKKAGLQPLTPAEYISAEASYKKVMRDSQLPAGFYDQPEDFAKFLGNDVSPSELQSRVEIANQSIQNADPFYTDSLRKLYGLNTGDMLAYTLDPERALPFITRQQKAAQFGAEAARQGLQVTTPMAEQYTGQLGVSQEQARQGFEQIAQALPTAEKLSQISTGGQPVGFEELTSAVFGGTGSSAYKQRLQKLSEEEQSRFAGQAGVGRGSLSRGMSGQI